MNDERLALIRTKVERAKKHIHDLGLEIRVFINTNPYEVGTKINPQTPDALVYYVVSLRETPPVIPTIVGDILFNLRAALDHLAYQLAWINGTRDEKILKNTYFPISDDSAKYKSEAAGKVKGMSQAAIKAIDACNPYREGMTRSGISTSLTILTNTAFLSLRVCRSVLFLPTPFSHVA